MSRWGTTSLTSAGLAIKPFVKALLGNADCGADFKPVELADLKQFIDASTANAQHFLQLSDRIATLVGADRDTIDILHKNYSFCSLGDMMRMMCCGGRPMLTRMPRSMHDIWIGRT